MFARLPPFIWLLLALLLLCCLSCGLQYGPTGFFRALRNAGPPALAVGWIYAYWKSRG
ncbi:hypothetical protein [Hymenobacter jeollabukensis]|nr:hypothetical protein [Hymenobacter jeollabukensis]